MSAPACGSPSLTHNGKEAASVWAGFRRRLLGIDLNEIAFGRRGFTATSPAARQRLEQIAETFVSGYHAALDEPCPTLDTPPGNRSGDFESPGDSAACQGLAERLQGVEPERRGFAFEGAAMALYLLDRLTPWRRDRWRRFVEGPGRPHAYMVHVGAGWAMARWPIRMERAMARMDPLLRWLAIDGYAFHEAYFRTERAVHREVIPCWLKGYARNAWDTGLGRGLWFVDGADAARIAARIDAFDRSRRADLWSGVGLACAYAGGMEADELRTLKQSAGEFRLMLGQGAAFAAKARERAGNPAAHTDVACQVLCGISAEQAAAVTDEALRDLHGEGEETAFEVWRTRIAARLEKAASTEAIA